MSDKDVMKAFDPQPVVRELNFYYTNPGATLGIPTGLRDLDELIGGYEPETYNIVAARPSVGKSTYLFSIMLNMARKGKKVGLLTQEMSERQVLWRAACFEL